MEHQFSSKTTKDEIFMIVRKYLKDLGLKIGSVDNERPWGSFFVIDAVSTDLFIEHYFPDYDVTDIKKYGGNLSPKILIVAPGQKLSWQYHYRRAELWKIVTGPVGVISSNDNTQGDVAPKNASDIVQYGPEARHRLVGLENWGIVAEIWQHTDPTHPSDEDDIVRLEDNYGR